MDHLPLNLITVSLFTVLFLHFPLSSLAKNPHCTPSSCGIIPNISYPFRLKADPKNCGDRLFELACENDVAFLYLGSQKYYVKAINYSNNGYFGIIRVVDPSITNDTCSFPISSLCQSNFTSSYANRRYPYDMPTPINFISCPNPLENYHQFTYINAECYSNSSYGRYDYIKVGHMNASELTGMCRLNRIVLTSWPEFKDLNNVTLSEIHDSLLYGLELIWCPRCGSYPTFELSWFLIVILIAILRVGSHGNHSLYEN